MKLNINDLEKNIFATTTDHLKSLEKPWVILKSDENSHWITHGPFSVNEIKEQLKIGQIKTTDYCWLSGWEDWKPIYLEPTFYLSRKPLIQIAKVEPEIQVEEFYEDEATSGSAESKSPSSLNLKTSLTFNKASNIASEIKTFWGEIAQRITPLQYKDWKYKTINLKNIPFKKQSSKTEAFEVKDYSGELSKQQGVVSMLEPWDIGKDLDFVEDLAPAKVVDKELETKSATPLNYPPEDFETPTVSEEVEKPRAISRTLRVLILMGLISLGSLMVFRLYSAYLVQTNINYSMSYFVVEDYMNELPEYLYARTDLKKNQQVKIRVFDLTNKQVRTRKSKAGLILSSQGSGRLRIPMYAYSLNPGTYKLLVEIEDQFIEKEFTISGQ